MGFNRFEVLLLKFERPLSRVWESWMELHWELRLFVYDNVLQLNRLDLSIVQVLKALWILLLDRGLCPILWERWSRRRFLFLGNDQLFVRSDLFSIICDDNGLKRAFIIVLIAIRNIITRVQVVPRFYSVHLIRRKPIIRHLHIFLFFPIFIVQVVVKWSLSLSKPILFIALILSFFNIFSNLFRIISFLQWENSFVKHFLKRFMVLPQLLLLVWVYIRVWDHIQIRIRIMPVYRIIRIIICNHFFNQFRGFYVLSGQR